jgi:hypothetical protein
MLSGGAPSRGGAQKTGKESRVLSARNLLIRYGGWVVQGEEEEECGDMGGAWARLSC